MATDIPRQLTGVFKIPNGTTFPNETVTFLRDPRGTYGQGGSVVADEIVQTVLNSAGEINVSLMAGVYLAMVRLSDADRYFNVHVPDEAGPHNIGDFIGENPRPGIITAILQAVAEIMEAYGELGPFVGFRNDVIAGFRSAGILRLENVAGTGDAITATLPDNVAATDFTAEKWFAFIAASDSTIPSPTITVGGHVRTIRDVDGAILPAGFIKAGRPYLFRTLGFTNALLVACPTSQAEIAKFISDIHAARADADALLDDGLWPGDDAVHAMGDNGAALVTMPDGTTRGTFLADDVLPGAEYSMLRNDEAAELRALIPSDFPGDDGFVISMGENGVAAAWDEQGRLRGTHVMETPAWPGDWIMALVIDSRGVVVEGYDTRDGSGYAIGIAISGWPGDFIIPLETDRTGRVARGYDIRDGSEYPAGSGGGGASVEFVDPGIVGDAWGAVADSNGVIKFTSRMWQGEVIGFEQRDGKVLADTGTIATGILAIGGGDIGVARSQRDYPWHVLDEALAYQGAGNGADAAAAAYLEVEGNAYRARPTVIPVAEVIGSTVEADVLPGAPRRVQLMDRVAAAVTALEAWDKRLIIDRIKLDLLDGAPGTAELTADTHYAAVGNGLRMEAATATGQLNLPKLIVHQGFGVREDGTSPVILAEGRLDWTHFALGFVIPTPLYPFDLEPGTLATLTQDSALMVSEIEALALADIAAGGEWFCPSLEEATLDTGTSTITARFATMTALIIRDPANHGFTISGESTTAVTITNVSVSGSFATITLDGLPDGTPILNYAFGQTGTPADAKPINRGSLTDSWSAQSRAVPSETLYRHARSGRVTI